MDFTNISDNQLCEKVHTKFIKYALGINKFASNHAIRAEVGRYPLEQKISQKLIKYWHRLENYSYEDYPLLAEAFNINKSSKHEWYTGITNYLESNGLGYFTEIPQNYSEN